MSLKSVGSVINALNVGKGISDIKDTIDGLSEKQKILAITSSTLSQAEQSQMLIQAGVSTSAINAAQGYTTMAASQITATGTTSGLSTAMTGLGATLKSVFISLATNPLTYLVAGLAVGAVALHNYMTAFDDAVEKAQESQSAYSSTTSEIESLNSELETTQSRISELQALKDAGTISLAEESELSRLQNQNKEIERQIELKQKLASEQSKQAANDAIAALKIEHTQDLTQQYTTTDKNGMVTHTQNKQTDIITASKNEISELRNLKKERDNLLNDDIKDTKQAADFEALDADIEKYTNSISDNIEQLNSLKISFEDGNGLMRSDLSQEAQNYYKSIIDIIDSFNNIDLSPAEQQLAAIESFFDGSAGTNFLKDELIEVAKSGEITTDTLADMGLTLGDLGLFGKDGLSALNKYFKDLASSADEANSSVKEFDGSLQSITDASESENQDKNWNTVSDLFDKAKELDKNKKWGTDDFQSMAQFIAPESAQIATKNTDLKAADYKDLWDKYKSNFEKYFDADNPLQSAINAQDKLLKSGLGSMDSSGIIKWSDSFKSSADAAKAWGISVEAAEVAMHNLESYGAEFDGITFNAEELENYKSSLEGIRAIYDQMDEGSDKDRLGKLLQGWDEEYAKYEQDISTLSEDQVVKIKFEYDLASIQQKINELQEIAEEGGDTRSWAELNAAKRSYRNKSESRDGNNSSNVDEYKNVSDTITALQQKLKGATNEQKEQIQDQISGLYDLQNAFNDAFADSGVSWDEFIKTDEYNDALDNMISSSDEAKETIAKLLGIDVEDITVDVEANDNASDVINKVSQEEIEDKIVKLIGEDDATPYINLWNIMSADPKFAELSADDQATLVLETYNSLSIDDKNSLISQTGGEVTKGVADAVSASINAIPKSKQSTITITTIKETINKAVTKAGSVKKSNGGIIAGGAAQASGTMLSHAHVYGTVRELASQNVLASAYVGGKVGLDTDQYAVINELGQESLIRDGIWRLLPPGMHMENLKKGDIILNAKQTSDLLKSGKTTGTARAYASGSLLAPAYGSGMLSLGGSYGKSYSSTTSKASTTKKSTTDTTTKAAQEVTKATENLVDFIKILLDRTQEVTKRLTDAIDDAVGLADKMSKNSSALTQIQKEISVNQNAYNQYMAQAKAVGLSETYAKQIRNGSLNISNITDENLKDKIDKYQEYFEAAQDCQDTILDLQREERDLALERLDYIESYYDALVSLNDAYKDVNETQLEYLEKIGSSAISDQVKGYYQDSYAKEYDSYGKALQQLADYTQEVNELLANGYLQEGSEEYLEAMKTIQEFTKQVDESAIALIELEDKIREIDYTRLQQLIDGSDRRTNQLKNAQSLAEARDEQIGRGEYQKQVDELSKSINANYALRDKKLQEQNLYDATSTRYQDLAKEIADLDGQIYDNLVDIEDLKDQIFEAEFFNYEKEQSNLEYFIGELEDFASLLNEDAFIDKTGAFTDEAYAKIALTADAMAKCKQQIANATEALNKLDEMYQNGLISETEYEEKQRELLDTVRENVSATESYKKELLDLYVTQARKENEALKKNIDLQKERLRNQKDYWDYAESLKSKTKTVNEIEAQIAALQGVFALSILIAGTS